MARVAPSERFRAELDEAFAGVGQGAGSGGDDRSAGSGLILQQALEDEVSEFFGRGRYERSGEVVSHRNGYEPRTVATSSGKIELERPRVRDASKLGFESKVLGRGVTRTYALESLVIGSFLRGLSTRDVEAVLEETFEQPVSSRSTVSRVLEETRERYRRWCRRRLDEHDLVYLFLDALTLSCTPTTRRPRACWSPGASRSRAEKCCSASGSARARATSHGSYSAAISPPVA